MFSKKSNAQGSLEYLIIIAAVLAISAVVVYFITGSLGVQKSKISIGQCKQAAADCKMNRLASNDPCVFCEDACIGLDGKDLMTGVTGCDSNGACGFCKQGEPEKIYEISHKKVVENCTNGVDDNGNGLIDCNDTSDCCSQSVCSGDPACSSCVDADGDGYGVNGGSDCTYPGVIDCNDSDASIHPDAAEVCNNGLDDDCDGYTDCDDSNCTGALSLVGSYDTDSAASGVFVNGDSTGYYAYVADGNDGLVIVNVSNKSSPQFVGSHRTSNAYGVFVVGDYAYVADGNDGLVIVNVSDKSNPVNVSSYDNYAGGVFVVGDYAYVAKGYGGLVVVNVSDKSNPQFVGSHRTSNADGVFVVGDYAYVADWDDGLVIVNVSDKSSPQFVGSYDTNGEAYGVFVVGDYAYVADGDDGLVIVNVSDKSNPVNVSSYDNYAESVFVVDNYSYTAAGGSGLRIFDVSDKSSPQFVGSHRTSNAHGVFVVGDYAYVADDDGLVILKPHCLS